MSLPQMRLLAAPTPRYSIATKWVVDRTWSAVELESIRQQFAEEIRRVVGVRSDALIRAFGAVPRERFVGLGPWLVGQGVYRVTPDDDPAHLYADVRVAIDPDRELNNGRPYVHARWIDELAPVAGEHIVHVGAGTGYYSAILAQIVGPRGRIIAIEADANLATQLRVNLADLPQVKVIEASGVGVDFGRMDGLYVNVGLTSPPTKWLDRLRIAGRMILPLTDMGPDRFGAVLWVRRLRAGLEARFLDSEPHLRIYPCRDGRSEEEEARLAVAFATGGHQDVRWLRRDEHAPEDACWLHSESYCLSWKQPGEVT